MAGAVQSFQPRELLIHTPDGKTRTLPLEHERYTLGRSSGNELCYSEDAGLSRQHLVIERKADTWTVQDLNSKNGTFVNGRRCMTSFLNSGDRISFGSVECIFQLPGGSAVANTGAGGSRLKKVLLIATASFLATLAILFVPLSLFTLAGFKLF